MRVACEPPNHLPRLAPRALTVHSLYPLYATCVELGKRQGKTVIVVTHDSTAVNQFGRVITIKDGIIESDQRQSIH